jgi:hypothetical protein
VQLDVGAPGQVAIAGISRTILRADLVPELLGEVQVAILGPKA